MVDISRSHSFSVDRFPTLNEVTHSQLKWLLTAGIDDETSKISAAARI